MITRAEGGELMRRHLANANLVKHVLAVEAIMRALARRAGESEETWGLAGLLHDLDYERTKGDPERHGRVTMELLEQIDVPEEVRHAILAHAGHVPRNSAMDKAIYCADPVTGLIVASALMHPSKKLSGLDPDFVGKRFREKRFAAGANRDAIATCSELGLELHEFLRVSIEAMNAIADGLGL